MADLRILVADDHDVVRSGLRALLEAKAGWEVCDEAATGREAVQKAEQLKPDVVVLDIAMPELNGLEAARQILKAAPRIEIVILTMHDSDQLIREVLEAGAHGFVMKSDAGRDLVTAVEAVAQHKTFFTSTVSERVLGGYLGRQSQSTEEALSRERLTPREREIVQLLAEGNSNKEVAATLGISVKTAETHRSNIMRKLNIHSVTELVHYALRNNIIHS